MRILFVSYFFPPYNTIGAIRTGKMVKYLNKMGHDLYVLTARNQPLQETLELEIPHEQVVYTNWVDVNKPVQLLLGGRKKIADRGYVLPKGILHRTLRLLGRSYKTIMNFPDGQIGWVPFAIKEGSRIIRKWKPDIIYASAMPHSSLLIARTLSRKFNIPWIAEFRDLWVDYQYYQYGFMRRHIERWLEHRTLKTASGFVTVSEPLAETIRRKYDSKPTQVIMNGFDMEDYTEIYRPTQADTLQILYTGMVYEGKEDPSPLFKAIHLLGEDANRIRVKFYGRYLDVVRDMAESCGVEHLVEIHSPVSYKEAVHLQCNADILLLLLWNDPKEKGIYSGKLFEYVGARRPILAVGSGDNVASELIDCFHVGVTLQDEHLIAVKLREWLDQKLTGMIQVEPYAAISRLSREAQAHHLDAFLHTVIKADQTTEQYVSQEVM